LRKIGSVEEANPFLRREYIAEFNRRFAVAAAGKGSAFVRTRRKDLVWVFSIQHERRVNADNTLALENRALQIEKSRWRNTWRVPRFGCSSFWMEPWWFGMVRMRWHAGCRTVCPSPNRRRAARRSRWVTGGWRRSAISLRQPGI
jgi:hypothetical protein